MDNPLRTALSLINIKLIELNSHPPQFDAPLYSASLFENSPIDTLVVRIRATDPDENRLMYSIDESLNSATLPFHLDKYTGEMRVNGRLDYEMKSEYLIDVSVRDLNFTDRSQVRTFK